MSALVPGDLRDLLGLALTDEQLAAATADLAPGVIVAGAGTGKTTVMAARVVWLVAGGQVAPEGVLGLTFTRKAAGELASRVRGALRRAGVAPPAGVPLPPGAPAVGAPAGADEPGEPEVSTYHAFAGRLAEEHGLRIGLEPGRRLLRDAARYQLAYRVVCGTRVPLAAQTAGPVQVAQDVLRLDEALAEHAVGVDALVESTGALLALLRSASVQQKIGPEMAAAAERRLELAALVAELRAAKAARDVWDFPDQVRLAMEVAETCPEVGQVLRERYQVVLLDEYQDTSTCQRRLMQALFGGGHPVTAVGDPCQAIYGWRGASVRNIDAFPQDFPAAAAAGPVPADRFGLTQNRRSGRAVLDLANLVAGDLRAVHPGVGALAGVPEKGDGRLRCALLPTYADELDWVAGQVAALGESQAWDGIAVLARKGEDLVAVQQALEARGVPAAEPGVSGLLGRPEVAEVLSTLEVVHDPAANPALLRLLTGPRWRIGARDLAALARRAEELVSPQGAHRAGPPRGGPSGGRGLPGAEGRGRLGAALEEAVTGIDRAEVVSLVDALGDLGDPAALGMSAEAAARCARLAAEVAGLRTHLGEPLVDLFHRVLDTTGLEVELASQAGPVAERRLAGLYALADVVAGFHDLDGNASLGAFLAWVADARRFDTSPDVALPPVPGSVVLLTAHRAKGLEFPVVVLPFLARDVFPSGRAQDRWPKVARALPLELCDDDVPAGLLAFPPPDGPRAKDHKAFEEASRELEELEEVRLGYVAVTRAEQTLVASGHWWGPGQKKPRGPGRFLEAVRQRCLAGDGRVAVWADEPAEGEANPALAAEATRREWPPPPDADASRTRVALARAVRQARDGRAAAGSPGAGAPGAAAAAWTPAGGWSDGGEMPAADQAVVAGWDEDVGLLLAEALREAQGPRTVRLPEGLSVTAVQALAADPGAFAARLLRPMPVEPSRAAHLGTRLHAWIAARGGQRPLLEPDDLPGAADAQIADDADLAALQDGFRRTRFADLDPYASEESFDVVLGGRVVRGRIDAVYREGDGWLLVDWKTGRPGSGDPLQLAVYRVAWAELRGVPLEAVRACFVYLRDASVEEPADLPDRAGLERVISGESPR